jgi:hypothetical protein
MLFFLDLREFRTTDGEHGTNLAGRGSLVRLMLALVITANYADHYGELRGVSLDQRLEVTVSYSLKTASAASPRP